MMNTVIWWVRRDLRLSDNQALHAAVTSAHAVIPLFILDHNILNAKTYSEQRFAFMLDGLRKLDDTLRQRGSRLIVRTGSPMDVLPAFVGEVGAEAVFAEADYSPYARKRDRAVDAALRIPFKVRRGLTARHPIDVEKKAGGYYTVFTPYKRMWLNGSPISAENIVPSPSRINTPENIASDTIPNAPALPPEAIAPVAGEAEAQLRLARFLNRAIYAYDDQRDLMAERGTSSLSPFLRFGMLSARQAVVAAQQAIAQAATSEQRKNAEVWLSELIWREFYQMILYHFPHVRQGSFRPVYDLVAWREDSAEFQAWCDGQTGYPVVDAAMRQLYQTGWMHNRARMIVASFLTKDLLISWQWGERWFMQRLLDGDHAANNGGWQWAAGTGTDAAPYFRIFNPISQSKKFDAAGDYIRRWVPELADVPNKYIHAPWDMPPMQQQLSNCVIGRDYPGPIVDHKFARERTLAAYKAAKERGEAVGA